MSRHLHIIDELFSDAYKQFEDRPSLNAWRQINAQLDKKAAENSRRKRKALKRISCCLVIQLMGLVLCDSSPAIQRKTIADRNTDHLVTNAQCRSVTTKSHLRTYEAPADQVLHEWDNHNMSLDEFGLLVKKMDAPGAGLLAPGPLPAISSKLLPQQSIETNTSPKRHEPFAPFWAVSGFASIDQADYRLDNDDPTSTQIKQRENHEASFSGGLLLTRQFAEKWAVQTGLIYSNTAIGIDPQKMYARQDRAGNVLYEYITSSGYAYIKPGFGQPPSIGDSLTTASAQHNLTHIIIPITIKHKLISKNKLSVGVSAGIAANFLTSAKIVTEIEHASNRENVSITKLNGVRPFNWSLMGGLDLQYALNRNTAIDILPSFRYAISPITKNNQVDTYPYCLGIGIGITHRF